jgi:hypothetical protein
MNPNPVEVGLVLFLIGAFVLLPIVKFLLDHQRRMTEIVRGVAIPTERLEAEMSTLRQEIHELRLELRSLGVGQASTAEKLRDHLSNLS